MSGREVLVRVSAALASRDEGRLERVLRRAADEARTEGAAEPDGLGGAAVEEVLLQSYLFLGYPAALNAFALWREVWGGPAPAPAGSASLTSSTSAPSASTAWEAWRERGAAVCETVYGSQYGRLRQNVRRLHPDLEEWMVVEGYGKVLGRPGLDLVERELSIVAFLAVLGAPRQLHSHLRGALNAGAAPDEVASALETALEYAGAADAATARDVWSAVRQRAGGA